MLRHLSVCRQHSTFNKREDRHDFVLSFSAFLSGWNENLPSNRTGLASSTLVSAMARRRRPQRAQSSLGRHPW